LTSQHHTVAWILTVCSIKEADLVKDAILTASVETVIQHGLNDWTVEEVANKAHCAKGLVNYHFRSKAELLQLTAETIAYHRQARRLAAIGANRGTSVLDNLWEALRVEVRSGWFAAWLGFAASEAAGLEPVEFKDQLRLALTRALLLPADALPEPLVLFAMLDGIALRLLLDEPEAEVKDAYHRLWLGLLTG
jgi:AcrR family transcriptional regulator